MWLFNLSLKQWMQPVQEKMLKEKLRQKQERKIADKQALRSRLLTSAQSD